MIVATVGMHFQPFDRLVHAVDELAGIVDEPVVIQRGVSSYTPASSRSFDFTDEAAMAVWISRARVVVAHGGAGSILEVLQAEKPLVLVPRLKRFGECLDDHQLELVGALARQGRAVAVMDPSGESLRQGIERASRLATEGGKAGSLQLALRMWLAEWAGTSTPSRPGLFWGEWRRG